MSKKPKIQKPVSKNVQGLDAKIVINVFSPDHEPQEFRFIVPNIIGESTHLTRSPEYIASAIVAGLRAKYGERVG